MARDTGMKRWKIFGKNWQGYLNRRPLVRAITPFVDRPMQLFPILCAAMPEQAVVDTS